jgi:hypothetical protein
MNEEVRKRLEHHRAVNLSKAEALEKELARKQAEEEAYVQWRSRAIHDVVEPAWATAIATLREAGFTIDDRPVVDQQPDQWHLAISSPHSPKLPRSTTLSLDRKGYYVFRKNTVNDRRYIRPDANVDRLVELIIDHSTQDLGPFA